MSDVDTTRAVTVGPGISWIGVTDEKTPFRCNPYVLEDGDEVVLFEPGSELYYQGVREKVSQVVSPRKIRYLVLSHQDPDLCASVPAWEEALGDRQFQIVTHSRTAVLLKHYGIKSKMYLVDRNEWVLRLGSGRTLQFVFAPWCHSPGTFMTYDDKTASLLSGDIFGALTYNWSLLADQSYPEAMRAFHEDYMASTPHLQAAMAKLDPLRIDRILPQHGSVIQQNVADCIAALKRLECGMTLMGRSGEAPPGQAPKPQKGSYQELIAFVLDREKGVLGLERALVVAKGLPGLEVDELGKCLAVKGDGKEVLGRLLAAYQARYGAWAVLNCKLALTSLANEKRLELPKLVASAAE